MILDVNITMSHAYIGKSHVNIIMLHVDISFLAYKGYTSKFNFVYFFSKPIEIYFEMYYTHLINFSLWQGSPTMTSYTVIPTYNEMLI